MATTTTSDGYKKSLSRPGLTLSSIQLVELNTQPGGCRPHLYWSRTELGLVTSGKALRCPQPSLPILSTGSSTATVKCLSSMYRATVDIATVAAMGALNYDDSLLLHRVMYFGGFGVDF